MSGAAVYTVGPVEWSSPGGDDARAVRRAVFIIEQAIPEHEEWDEADATAHHVVARDAAGRPVATGRLLAAAGEPGALRIGRMAVLREARGTGAGAAVMRALLAEGLRRGARLFVLNAQDHALGFYARFGFRPVGGGFPEAGIPHHRMEAAAGDVRAALGG